MTGLARGIRTEVPLIAAGGTILRADDVSVRLGEAGAVGFETISAPSGEKEVKMSKATTWGDTNGFMGDGWGARMVRIAAVFGK